ncbi:MAG: FAD-binding oxidoreductase [Armatimonadetes bacterium]|nr:FAD-binding oxidoreductase [Armatimonadota bacterium]
MSLEIGLRALVGEEGRVSPHEFAVGGQSPPFAIAPVNEEELAATLKHASASGAGCSVFGSGSMRNAGNSLSPYDFALSGHRLKPLIDFQPEEMIVTVSCSVAFPELQRALAEAGHWLPWNPPASNGTIGGIIATGRSGSLRFRHGTPRDRLLAMRMALANGNLIKSGAKVVKSVAGYDLHRLFCGSWGVLGVILEVTLKTSPRPERSAWFVAKTDEPEQAIANILSSPAQPDAIDVINTKTLAVALSGFEEEVDWQLQAIKNLGIDLAPGDEPVVPTDSPVLAKIVCRPSDTIEVAQKLAQTASVDTLAHAGSGIVYAYSDDQGAADLLASLRSELGLKMMFWSLPPEKKATVRAWPELGDAAGLMKAIKQRFDPSGLFEPGRFFP